MLWLITATGTVMIGFLHISRYSTFDCQALTEHKARLGSEIDEARSWAPSLVNCTLFFYNNQQSARQSKAVSRSKRSDSRKVDVVRTPIASK